MKIHKVDLEKTVAYPDQYPTSHYPEFALSGRSNVGKSSLINAILNRKKLARTSSSPGKTQTLNFFNVNDDLYLVDVPGYGYAKVSKKMREKFGQMIETYLESREELKGMILLMDSRHKPTQDDVAMYQYAKYLNQPLLIVATKIDKVKKSQWNKVVKNFKDTLELDESDDLILFSSEKKYNIDALWQWVEDKKNNA
ncbi:ribosome biogenesis GTP-binding protein YihA/YsxC [Holzapfeliella sp. He02]|uniref:Probable GTP-binding protein EngB n=1 Tax=Holzapfeliella saturejae TaxID=3082953 RepID=A0ABU8SI51_9LACO